MNKKIVSSSDAIPYQEFAKIIGKTPAAVRGMIEKGKLPVTPTTPKKAQLSISPPKASVRRSPIAILLMLFIGYRCDLAMARRAGHLNEQGSPVTCVAASRLSRHLSASVFQRTWKLWSAGIRKRLYAGYSTRLSATYCVALMR